MGVDALVIDLDGTLWDSAPWYARAVAADDDEMTQLTRAFADPVGAVRAAVVIRQRLGATRFTRYCTEAAPPACYANAVEVLSQLSATGVKLGVFTSLPAWMATSMLKAVNLGSRFAVVQTARRGIPGKPHPLGLQLTLAKLPPNASAVYLGDTELDRGAAERADVPFVWAGWGYGTPSANVRIASDWRDVAGQL